MPRPALGLIETSGIDGAIKATRAASASGQVVIVSVEQGAAGHMTIKIEGDWAAVQSAIEAGARVAYQAGELVSMHVIPRPDQEVNQILPYARFVDRFTPDDKLRSEVIRPQPSGKARAESFAPSPRRNTVKRVRPAGAPVSVPVAVASTDSQTRQPAGPGFTEKVPDQPAPGQLEQMAVVALRRYARTLAGLPIKGRQISKANKQQLLEAIGSIRKLSS